MANHEVKVGAFALSGAAVLAGIITFMGALSFGPAGYKLHINYPQVDGLMKGHMVRYAGVQVGTVKDIKVATDKVEVVADIEKNIKIPKGAAFTISADGMFTAFAELCGILTSIRKFFLSAVYFICSLLSKTILTRALLMLLRTLSIGAAAAVTIRLKNNTVPKLIILRIFSLSLFNKNTQLTLCILF